MNAAFGNPKGDPQRIDFQRLRRQCRNILQEYEKELVPALDSNNIDLIRDTLCDIVVFALGGYHFMGFDADEDMTEVISAVMTRFCKTPEQLLATCQYFDKLGVEYYVEGEFPTKYLKSSKDQGDGEYPKGKFLKAVGYRQPMFRKPPVVLLGHAQTSPATIVADMAKLREKIMSNDKMLEIERRTTEFRAKLELELLGLPPFESANNGATLVEVKQDKYL